MPLPQLLHDITDLIYPRACISCQSHDVPAARHFCDSCSAALTKLSATPTCDRCAKPLGPAADCPYCHGKGLYPFEQIIALAPYRDPLRKLIHQLKYRHRWPITEILAGHLLQQPRIQTLLSQTDILIPVPLHWTRQIARGYNQSQTLAAHLAKKSRAQMLPAIVRLKNTPPQSAIRSQSDRAENLRGAFAVTRPRALNNKRITIIDDVLTTGATLKSIARALEAANPASLSAIVIAVSDPRRRDFQSTLAGTPAKPDPMPLFS